MASTSPRRSGDPPSPSSPLLPSPPSPSPSSPGGGGGGGGPLGRLSGLRGAARFIRRTGSRRLMREPSVAVRETAAEHLEERQTDWAYSKPVVVLDVLWNLAFVAVAAAVLAASLDERPLVPLRAWLAGYVVQCLLHVLCVVVEYRRRTAPRADQEGAGDGDFKLSVVKHLESANTMFSFIWWIVGFYWVSAGGQALSHDAPQLYWLTIVFLAFDVFFVVFCVALACVIGIAVCCCLPCIIAILYAVTDQQEGASEEDINNLSKYKFRTMGDADKLVAGIAAPVGGVMTECGTSPPVEHILSAEDADGLPRLMMLSGHDEGASLPSGCTMRILVHLGGEPLIALVDSGATHNIIALDVANRFRLRVTRACVHVTIANGTSMESKGICRNIRLSIGSNIFAISSYVVHIPDVDVVLGAPWLESLGAIMWNFSKRVMKFRYNDRDIELNGLMIDGMEEDVKIPQSLSSPSTTLTNIPKAGLFNDIRCEVGSEPELNAMLDGIQKGDHGYPWEVIDGIIFYNNRIYIPLWSPILVHILNAVHQLGDFDLLDDIAIGIHEPSSSPSTRSFPTSILLPQAIPQKSIQTCNVIMADYFGTEFLSVSGVIWQPQSVFVGPSRVFLDDSAIRTFFGICIDDAYGHDGVHTTSPTFLVFVNVFCRESKWRPFFASPPREDTVFNYVQIESKAVTVPWVPIPSSSLCFHPQKRFALEGQIGTLGFQLQLRIYGDANNVYEHIQIGELQTLMWAMDYSIKFQRRGLIGTKLEDELCHNEDGLGKAQTTILPCFSHWQFP